MRFYAAGCTDVGKLRSRNEDAIQVRNDAGLWVVADGLGGHTAGDYASQAIVERLSRVRRGDDAAEFAAASKRFWRGSMPICRNAAFERGVDIIASTVVLLIADGDSVRCGWVGDSRAYSCVGGTPTQLTRDHVYRGDHDADERPAGSGVLTRAMGAETTLSVDWVRAPASPGTVFVLCSDGLNKEMSDAEIAAVCGRHDRPLPSSTSCLRLRSAGKGATISPR